MPRGLVVKLTPDQVADVFSALPRNHPMRAQLMAAVKLNNGPHPRLMDLTHSRMVSAYEYEQLTDMGLGVPASTLIPKGIPE